MPDTTHSIDQRFASQRNLVASDYGIRIVHKPTFSEGGRFFQKTTIDNCIITGIRRKVIDILPKKAQIMPQLFSQAKNGCLFVPNS